MIELRKLHIGYPGNALQRDLTATLESGMLTCLIGKNGVGKSTLLRTIAGFQAPLAGTAVIDGMDVGSLSRHEFAKRVSIVLTSRPEMEHITVEEVVGLGRSPYTNMWGRLDDHDREIVAESIAAVGITALAGRRLVTLSDGECQKVMIAKALAQDTPIIILDEPTAFLDYPSKVETMQLLRRLAHEGKAILLSTHDLDMAVRSADRLWMLRSDGLTTGTPEDIVGGDISRVGTKELCALF